MKICKRCKQKLESQFFSKAGGTKDGLQFYCKKCKKALDSKLKKDKSWQTKTKLRHEKEFLELETLPTRTCKKCQKEKSIIEMTKNWQYRFGFTSSCRECVNEKKRLSGSGVGKRWKVLCRDNFKCQYCGRSSPEVELEVDHIFPDSKGGTSSMENLITACRDCNRGKSDSLLPGK
jgi:5-methylcytosine-specific restriction endonuclease McrA